MFVSDNVSSVCPPVMQAIIDADKGDAAAYGGDEATNTLNAAFSKYFGNEVVAFPVGTGTAANALSLALATPRLAAIYCHQYAHIETTEGGASEAWSGGSKLILLPGKDYRINPETLKTALSHVPRGARPQSAPPAVISITQGTEAGRSIRSTILRRSRNSRTTTACWSTWMARAFPTRSSSSDARRQR